MHTDAHSAHITTDTYSSEEEDFASADASTLDTWVFERVDRLFQSAADDPLLAHRLHSDRVMFLLHLLGLDTNGHAHKPHSM